MTLLLTLAFNLLAGFNDGGNLLATLLPARLRPILLWLWLAAIVAVGPLVLGTHVADTITRRLLPPEALAQVLLPALLGSLLVVVLSWWQRVPTSMSLALIGAMAGAGGAAGLPVTWGNVLGALLGFVLTVALGGLLGRVSARGGTAVLRRIRRGHVLGLMLMLTAALEGIAYGGNDLEKAVGLLHFDGLTWHLAIVFSVLSFALGGVVGSWRIARTVGSEIIRLRPPEALYTQVATGLSVVLASLGGFPVSTSQTVDASLLGVGSAENPRHVGWGVVRRMAASWILTPVLAFAVGGVLAWLFRIA